ncbi:MAG TPA: DUF1338 family protein [Candidatus Binatia bacterium]|nr:DUF1338 family protein [Candidatus Binatia bacterium]
MSRLLDAAALRALFVERATAKFARNVPDFVALRELVQRNGGSFRNDHGAIRSADPVVTGLLVRGAGALGMRRELEYAFPAKKLKSFDLQVPGTDASQFKIFVSQVDLDAFPPAVAAMVREDCAAQAQAVDYRSFLDLVERAHSDGLAPVDAERFLGYFVEQLMHRNGPPLARATLEAVAAVSGEAASALALGPDFNHLTIDVRAAGFDGIEAMAAAMKAAGFRLLPQIQGAPGTKLRQTATLAQTMDTPVREADGRVGTAQTEKQFVEIIERASPAPGQPVFKNFLAANAEKIFDAASTRSRR